MPTQTFLNLPDGKKQRIIQAGIDEFSMYSFDNSNIARIVKNADIPRGSFYQYFENIKDLYRYIFIIIGERKLEYLEHVTKKRDKLGVFGVITELYRAGIKFAYENPKLAQIGNRFYKEDDNLRQEILASFEHKTKTYFENLIKEGQMKGEIDKKIDPKVASYIFFIFNINIIDLFLAENTYEDLINDPDKFLSLVDKVLYIIENGMKNTEN